MTIQRKISWKPKCTIFVKESILSFIEQETGKSTNHEIGGIIAGLGSVENGSIVISHASDSGPEAFHSPTFFSRDTAYCQSIVDEWASKSFGKIDYLGEWHKHFENKPKPSNLDLQTLKRIARNPDYHVSIPVLLIIGNLNARSSIRIFLIDQKGQCASMKWQPVS